MTFLSLNLKFQKGVLCANLQFEELYLDHMYR